MSRRYRLETEKPKQIEQEAEEEEDKIKLQRERIYAPVIWQRLGTGFRIEDLKENRYEEVVEMFKTCYFQEEVLCRNTCIAEDELSVEYFLKHLFFQIKNSCSLVAIDEAHQEVMAGALVLTVVRKLDFGPVFNRMMLVEGEALKKCMKIKNHLCRKTDIFAEFDCDMYLRYYGVCVKPEYRKRGVVQNGLGKQLMKSAVSLARSCSIPVFMGMFSSRSLQQLALKLGMKVIHEINYAQWRDEKGELIFDDPGAGNYTFAIMAGRVPPPPPPEPEKPSTATQSAEAKKTRKEKRAHMAKRK